MAATTAPVAASVTATQTTPPAQPKKELSWISNQCNRTVDLLPSCIEKYMRIENDSSTIATVAKIIPLSVLTLIVNIGSFVYNSAKWAASHVCFCCSSSSSQAAPTQTPPTPPAPVGTQDSTSAGQSSVPSAIIPSATEVARQKIAAFAAQNPQFTQEVKDAYERGMQEGSRAVEDVRRDAQTQIDRIRLEADVKIREAAQKADSAEHLATAYQIVASELQTRLSPMPSSGLYTHQVLPTTPYDSSDHSVNHSFTRPPLSRSPAIPITELISSNLATTSSSSSSLSSANPAARTRHTYVNPPTPAETSSSSSASVAAAAATAPVNASTITYDQAAVKLLSNPSARQAWVKLANITEEEDKATALHTIANTLNEPTRQQYAEAARHCGLQLPSIPNVQNLLRKLAEPAYVNQFVI